ncbi:MAG TPA: Fe2+-dependent dioxygenase [Gammaproteobacteria bacterium]|nr:Fe2+-dependent dioxygenase [Gammaproteobacteria bacterium]
MLTEIHAVLGATQVEEILRELAAADWADGRGSAGYLSHAVKRNQQLPDADPVALELGRRILRALEGNPRFVSAALPHKVLPPLFNRYEAGSEYGAHIDGAIRPIAGTAHRIRTDLSATLFLSPPDSYDGGELIVEDPSGTRRIKLAAGDLILYPASSVHSVAPVTRGTRYASFFWVQSMVRDDRHRRLLFELDGAIQALAATVGENRELVRLAGVYHNMLRLWADT